MTLLSGVCPPVGFVTGRVLLLGLCSGVWVSVFLLTLLYGASLPVGLAICCLGASLLVGRIVS